MDNVILSVPDQHYKAAVSHEDRGPLRECLQELQKHFIFVTKKMASMAWRTFPSLSMDSLLLVSKIVLKDSFHFFLLLC